MSRFMKLMTCVAVLGAAGWCAPATGSIAVVQSGSLTDLNGVYATDGWDGGQRGSGFKIGWTITQYTGEADGDWTALTGLYYDSPINSQRIDLYPYTYVITNRSDGDLSKSFSEFALGVSINFTSADLANLTTSVTGSLSRFVDNYVDGNGQRPPLENPINRVILFESLSPALQLTINFDSDRAPVLGDFYADDGSEGGGNNKVWVQAYNNYLLDPPGADRIYVPDSVSTTTVVPEPATLIIWSLLGAGSWLGVRVCRRRRGPAGRQPWSPENRQAIHDIIARGTHR